MCNYGAKYAGKIFALKFRTIAEKTAKILVGCYFDAHCRPSMRAFLPYKVLGEFPNQPSTCLTSFLVTSVLPFSVTDEQHIRIK